MRPEPVMPAGGWLIDPEADPDPDGVEGPVPERVPLVPVLDRTPVIHGTRAAVGPETFRRTWAPKRKPYVPAEVPPPLLPAVELGEDDEDHLPPNARKLASAAHAAGWWVCVSFAIGHEIDSHGRPAVDITWSQEVDEGGKESRRKVGETRRPQQPSVLVRVAPSLEAARAGEPDSLLAGLWVGGEYAMPGTGKWKGAGWGGGQIVYPWRQVDWSTLWRAFESLRTGERAA